MGCTALGAAGCGGGSGGTGASPADLRLQRENLVAVSRALALAQGSVENEVAAARAAWPLVAGGVPEPAGAGVRAAIQAAAGQAAKVAQPPPLQEAQATTLTGPGSQVAGLFQSFDGLAKTGWQMIASAIDAVEHGSPAAARFARANVALYIESVYDAHFALAQIGKKLTDGYGKLGGAEAFGAALTPSNVQSLSRSYSEASVRLHPHVRVRLGS
jgi:hypothetical protein